MDRLDPQRRRYVMQQVRRQDTGPEMSIRSLLHRMGYRFRLHRKDLPGTPDIVMPGRKTIIFVHGCFWHGHGCRIGMPPKSRLDYWQPKITSNQDRDLRNINKLRDMGWQVEVIWQCELRNLDELENRIKIMLPKKDSV